MGATPHVGTLREKPLHAALKRWYADRGDLIEQPVDGFVIDIVRDGVLIEIQTSGFAAMRRKLVLLLHSHAVRVVHPIPVEKWIVRRDESGDVISRRKSPKRGAPADVFAELVSFPELVAHAGLTIELLLVREEEERRFDGSTGWRRRGWVVDERRLLEVVDRLVIASPEALAAIVPSSVPPRFTTADVADAIGRPRRLAQQMTYCLRRVGVIEVVGKERNAIVYRRAGGRATRVDGEH